MTTVLPVGMSLSAEILEYEDRLHAAWEYKDMCLRMIWSDREGRELLSNSMAERFVQVLLLTLMGERDELQKPVFWQYSEEEEDSETAELPGCAEPGYDLLLENTYKIMTQIYTTGDMDTVIYRIIHDQSVLHQFLLLLHSPDRRERQDVERLFEQMIWALRPQLITEPDFVMNTLKTIMGLLQGGLHDLRHMHNEVALRSAPHLLQIFFEYPPSCANQ